MADRLLAHPLGLAAIVLAVLVYVWIERDRQRRIRGLPALRDEAAPSDARDDREDQAAGER